MKKLLTVALAMFILGCQEQADPTSATAGPLFVHVPGNADGFIVNDGQDHVGRTIVITGGEPVGGNFCGFILGGYDAVAVTAGPSATIRITVALDNVDLPIKRGDRFKVTSQEFFSNCVSHFHLALERLRGSPR